MNQTETKNQVTTLTQEPSKEIRLSCLQLAEKLMQEESVELRGDDTLVIHQIDSSDLLSAVEEVEAVKRVGILVNIMRRFNLEVRLEGSLNLGPLVLADHSWSFKPGESGFFRLSAKPTAVRKSLFELVSFLTKLPVGQALVLKPFQELFLEEIPTSDLVNYYQFCQEEKDVTAHEKKQDELFTQNCSLLTEKNLTLKIYGLNAKQLDRHIDTNIGGIFFKPTTSIEHTHPRIVAVLLENKNT